MMRIRNSLRWSSQRGESNAGCLLWLAILLVVVVVCWKMIPVKIASATLYDFMEEEARWAEKKPPSKIRKDIFKKAQELNLPITEKQIDVRKVGDFIKMRVEYTVPVEFPGYTYNWDFEHTVDRAIYIF